MSRREQSPEDYYHGKKVLIIGGASKIGARLVSEYCSLKCKTYFTYSGNEGSEEKARAVVCENPSATAISLDLLDSDSIESFFSAIPSDEQRLPDKKTLHYLISMNDNPANARGDGQCAEGCRNLDSIVSIESPRGEMMKDGNGIDILVHLSGVDAVINLMDPPEDERRYRQAVSDIYRSGNLLLLSLAHTIAASMRACRGERLMNDNGHIIVAGSCGADFLPQAPLYSASKNALRSLTRNILFGGSHLKGPKVRVTNVEFPYIIKPAEQDERRSIILDNSLIKGVGMAERSIQAWNRTNPWGLAEAYRRGWLVMIDNCLQAFLDIPLHETHKDRRVVPEGFRTTDYLFLYAIDEKIRPAMIKSALTSIYCFPLIQKALRPMIDMAIVSYAETHRIK